MDLLAMTSLKDCPLFPPQPVISHARVDAQLSQTSPCPFTFLPASHTKLSSSLFQPPLISQQTFHITQSVLLTEISVN